MSDLTNITKQQLLGIIKTLSALESWSFAEKHKLPDYLADDIARHVELLSAEILRD